jgi:hypothetical protein
MSQSTPINMIRRGGEPSQMDGGGNMPDFSQTSHSDSQLVEDILKEMGESPGSEQQSNINSQSYQYAMDPSQAPAYKYIPQQDGNGNGNQNYNGSYAEKLMNQQVSNNGMLSQFGINLSGESIKEKIMKNIKYPGLVFVLCFIISLPEFNRFLFSFFPRLLLESGQVSIGGVILKAFVGMIIFAIIALFL